MKHNRLSAMAACALCGVLLAGCDRTPPFSGPDASKTAESLTNTAGPARDASPVCLVPTADGETVYENEWAAIDASNVSEGYIMARYAGSNPKVKLQITGPDGVTYTYNLIGRLFEAFPLTAGDGDYTAAVYENISGSDYVLVLSEIIPVTAANEFGPYLYPNQYVDFTPESETVRKAEELAEKTGTDLEVVSAVYNYIIKNITYDYDKAENVESGYTADIDAVLETGRGICLDYAAVMAGMLRSQDIPTRLEVGYVDETYHAWISTYIRDAGWVNGIVEFDGRTWKLMDPTFAAGSSEHSLRKFIGDGSRYDVKYMY